MEKYKCPFCGNEDPRFFGFLNGKIYCRYCISFHGEPAEKIGKIQGNGRVFTSYELTEKQKTISSKILSNYIHGKNTLVYAVTGAGKTELVLESISYCLKHSLIVGFAIPRKDVVIELYERLSSIFRQEKVIAVYGGNTCNLQGNLIILTTHQLYRYNNYFDLLIMDEIDAFPYKGNKLLFSMFKRSIKHNFILLSATPSHEYIEEFKKESGDVVCLFSRFHGHPLPVPKIIIKYGIFRIFSLVKMVKKCYLEKKPVLIFVPTIDESENVFTILKIFIKKGNYVNSAREERERIIQSFRKNNYSFLVTTSVLERGITIENLQVIIFDCDNSLYDDATLVQISGRAGRKANYPDGDVIFLAKKTTNSMVNAINTIKEANKNNDM